MDIEEENIKVVVRIRPMQTEEKKCGDVPCVKGVNDGREVQVKVGPLDAQVYRCNHCFNAETNQVEFFLDCGITDLLDSAIQGYRACAFTFGQTGAGKTHTMIGSAKGISSRDKNVGLVPRSLDYLYERLAQMNVPFKIKLSCLEIYHEHVYDLFAEDKERTPMAVREHNLEGFFLEGARLVECSNYNIACDVLDVAFKNRQVGFHDLNSRSSRSHCMTEIYIETFPPSEENPEHMVRGKMSLVDLAGSERLKSTNSTGKVLQEAGFINRSLYVLGKVIAGLVRTNGDLNHKDVPFRDSKLTKLLISSLGGSSRTLMISCVSEAKGSQAETLRTLKFSMSCARIRNKPIKFLDPQERLIVDLKDEIRRLRQENQRLRSTLVTAPSGSESVRNLMGEDMSPSRMRASSANSKMSPTRRSPEKLRKESHPQLTKKRPNAMGVNGWHPKKSHNNSSSSKTKKQQKSEIFYKYPQLERILNDNDSVGSLESSPMRGRMRPGKASNASESIMMMESGYDSIDSDDNGSAFSQRNQQKQQPVRRSMKNEQLEEIVRRRASGPMILKDVQSMAYEPLRESRLNKYYPAENHIRTMDQRKIEVLEQRIAKMEAQQMQLQQLQGGQPLQPQASQPDSIQDEYYPHNNLNLPPTNAYDDEAAVQSAIAIDGSELIIKAGKKPGNQVQKKKKKKKDKSVISPYISHLDTNNLQKFQQELTEPLIKSRAELPPVVSRPVAKASMAAPQPKPSVPAPTAPQPTVAEKRKERPRVSEVRSSVDQELEELGLLDMLGKPAVPAANKNNKGVASSKSTAQIDSNNAKKNVAPAISRKQQQQQQQQVPNKSQSLPQIQSKQQQIDGGALVSANSTRKRGSKDVGGEKDSGKVASHDTTSEKLPSIKIANSSSVQPSSSAQAKKVPNSLSIANEGPSKSKPPSSSPTSKKSAAISPVKNHINNKSPVSNKKLDIPNNTGSSNPHEDDDDFMPPTPDRLKEKLNVLEASLVSKRIEMEDNPGEVTNEIEEKFKTLQLETLVIKRQLSELTGDIFPEGESRGQSASTVASHHEDASNTPVVSIQTYSPGQALQSKMKTASPSKEDDGNNGNEDDYGDDDFENEENASPQRPRSRISADKLVPLEEYLASASEEPVAIPLSVAESEAASSLPSAMKASSQSFSQLSPNKSFASTSVLVVQEMLVEPAIVKETLAITNSSKEAMITARQKPDVEKEEEDGYDDDYDVDFEADDDAALVSKSKSQASSPSRKDPSEANLYTEPSPKSTAQSTFGGNVTSAASSATTLDKTSASSSPSKRAESPSKAAAADDDEEAYADDGFDDFDVSFNEDN